MIFGQLVVTLIRFIIVHMVGMMGVNVASRISECFCKPNVNFIWIFAERFISEMMSVMELRQSEQIAVLKWLMKIEVCSM